MPVRRVRLRRRLSQPCRAAHAERVVRAGVRLHQRRHVHEHMSTAAGHCSSTRDDAGARTPLAIGVVTGVLPQLSQPLRLWTRLHHRAQVHHAALGPCSMSACRLYTPTAMAAVSTVPTSVLTSPFALGRGCLSASVVLPVAARRWPPRGRHRQRAPSWSGERSRNPSDCDQQYACHHHHAPCCTPCRGSRAAQQIAEGYRVCVGNFT